MSIYSSNCICKSKKKTPLSSYDGEDFCYRNCGKKALFITKKGLLVCSQRPAQCDSVQNKMKQTSFSLYGVENASSCEEVKKIREDTIYERYGVKNASNISGVSNKISNDAIKRWQDKFEALKKEISANEQNYKETAFTKKEYYRLVSKITEINYRENIDLIDPERKRSSEWHLDHKISICYGFYNKLSPYLIGNISNLEIISHTENMSKGFKCSDKTLLNEADVDAFEKSFNKKTHPTYELSNETGVCKYCNNLARYKSRKNEWCCSSFITKCPELKRKNSEGQLKK